MREIKFRAWDTDNKTMTHFGFYDVPEMYSDKDTVMQFTGLKDKNGKEIYEGDVLMYPATDGRGKGSVEWSDSFCSWMLARADYSETFSSFAYPRHTDGTCRFEIIGNIYENPELLSANETE